MFESLKETITKKFLTINPPKSSSLTSSEPDVDIKLGGSEYDLPYLYAKKAPNQSETRRQGYQTDAYIKQYRRMAIVPEISGAIDEIQNEALGIGIEGSRVPSLTFDVENSKVTIPDTIQKKILDCWADVMRLTRFQTKGKDIFRQWYIDGRIIAETVFDESAMTKGIQQILILSPLGFREKIEKVDKTIKVFYQYEASASARNSIYGTHEKYDYDQIVFVTSGIKYNGLDVGYLYPAIKTSNNLVMIEDSVLIYRVLRAVETRVWNVNIGRMPKSKAENYLTSIINQIKTDIAYDSNTGEFKGYTDVKSMINDYVFPSRNGQEQTSVNTIGGNTNFIESLDDLQVFLKKLYIALKIPVNRLDDSNTLDYSADDILRGEEKFLKTINDIQINFSQFLLELLKRQLISKKVIAENEWNDYEYQMKVIFQSFGSNQIVEKARVNSLLKKAEATQELVNSGVVGKIISYEFMLQNIWNMTKEEFEEQKKIIEEEKKNNWFYDLDQSNQDEENQDGENEDGTE